MLRGDPCSALQCGMALMRKIKINMSSATLLIPSIGIDLCEPSLPPLFPRLPGLEVSRDIFKNIPSFIKWGEKRFEG